MWSKYLTSAWQYDIEQEWSLSNYLALDLLHSMGFWSCNVPSQLKRIQFTAVGQGHNSLPYRFQYGTKKNIAQTRWKCLDLVMLESLLDCKLLYCCFCHSQASSYSALQPPSWFVRTPRKLNSVMSIFCPLSIKDHLVDSIIMSILATLRSQLFLLFQLLKAQHLLKKIC